MTKKPLYNALIAIAYIIAIVGIMSFVPRVFAEQKDNIFMPMGALALLTLSAAFMAYVFFYQPVLMLLDGKRAEAIAFFLKTVGIFAGLTVVVFLISLIA